MGVTSQRRRGASRFSSAQTEHGRELYVIAQLGFSTRRAAHQFERRWITIFTERGLLAERFLRVHGTGTEVFMLSQSDMLEVIQHHRDWAVAGDE